MVLDWLICFCMVFSAQAVITYAAVRMLRSTKPWVIWAVAVGSCMITAYSNSFATADFQAAWSTINLVISIVTYVAFSELKLIKAALVVACIMLVTLIAEFAVVLTVLYGFGADATTGPAFAYTHPGAYAFLIVSHAVVLALLFYVAAKLLERVTIGKTSENLARTMLFPASQAVLLVVSIVIIRVATFESDRALLLGAVFTLAMLVIYLAYYLLASLIHKQERLNARIAVLREQNELMLEHAQAVIAESKRVAKLRHDFRNKVQVVELLYAQGDKEKATGLLDELLCECEQEAQR